MTKTIVQIDASSLRDSDCFLHFYRKVILGYRSRGLFADMEYGSAWHKFREQLAITQDADLAINAAQTYLLEKSAQKDFEYPKNTEFLNVAHLTMSCKTYLDKFGTKVSYGNFSPLVVDGKPLVEQTFAIPFYTDDNLDILLVGTIDELGKLDGGCHGICDDKTTRSWNRADYLNEYKMKVQLRFYVYALHKLAEQYPDSIFKEMVKHRIGARINGVFLHKDKQTEFVQSDFFFFGQEDMEELEDYLRILVSKVRNFITPTYPYREGIYNGACHGKFGKPCEFIGICQAPAEARELMLKNNFERSPYNPLMFRK